jgi:sulfonate transport system permease protein
MVKHKIFAEQLMVPLDQIWASLLDLLHNGDIEANLKISIIRVTEGFLAGASIGLVLGTVMGLSATAEAFIAPFFNAVRQVPLFAWIPMLMLAVGVGEPFKVVFISLGALYPVTMNTFQGIRHVPREYLEVGSVFEYGRVALLRKIILPAALPSILTGIRLGLSMSWMSVVGAEFIASSEGVGYMIVFARQLFQTDVVMVGIVIIGLVGLAMDLVVRLAQNRLLRWRKTGDAQ